MLESRMKEHEIEEWRLEEEERAARCREEGTDFVKCDDHTSLELRLHNACNGIAFELENLARRTWDALSDEQKRPWALAIINGGSYAGVAHNFITAVENGLEPQPPRQAA